MKISSIHSIVSLISVMAIGLALSARADGPAARPRVGDKAPLIVGKDQNGRTWKLAHYIGKNVLLYFYPKDQTPGCTREACSFRDGLEDFKKDNVEVVGVSFDDQDSHQAFIEKNNLNFTLLADTDGKIADAYGARKPGMEMARRVSFLIGLDGKIIRVIDSPNPDIHIKGMKAAISGLKKPE